MSSPNNKIRVALAGIGNCASSLVQGVSYYRDKSATGVPSSQTTITEAIDGFKADDVEFVAAFDVDRRKVGSSLADAIFAPPNCSFRFSSPPVHTSTVRVEMAPVLDGVAAHVGEYPVSHSVRIAETDPCDVVMQLRDARAEVLVIYLPVGAYDAVRYFADAAIRAGVALVNCVPVFIANDPGFAERFTNANLPLIGDDVRSQVGATILHQRIVGLLNERGYKIKSTYQLNIGGNTDFLNMLDRSRLVDKKKSKTGAVVRMSSDDLNETNTHIGPSDYVPSQGDQKIAFIHVEAEGFGGAPLAMDVRLSVEDSPNSAAVVIDAVRYAGAALRRGVGGVIHPACSYYMKTPPSPLDDNDALCRLRDRRWT